MSGRISFNKPQGQPVHINSGFGSSVQPSSTFYQGISAEPNITALNYNHSPPNYYQHTINNHPAGYVQPTTFYRNGENLPQPQRETVAIERERVQVKQIERPQYQKVYNVNPPHKKLGPEEDPPNKSSCCHPCWLALAAILGIAAITLALLFGLGVIGSKSNNPTTSIVIAKPSSISSTTTTNNTNSTTTTSTSSTPGSIPTGVTSVSSAPAGSTSTSSNSISTVGVQPASISPIEIPPTTTSANYIA